MHFNCIASAVASEIHLDDRAGRGKNRLAAALSQVTERPYGMRARESGGPVASPVSVPIFEGQAVRTAVGVALVIVCLGLTGCSLFGKKQAAHKTNPKPFLGAEAPAKSDLASLPRDTGPLPKANGLLAGQVVIEATDQPIKASILIKSLDREKAKGADLDLSTDESGYFNISKLNAGETYELIVRANEHGELISRKLYAQPPNPTLLIRLDKRWTTASTPPPPDMPKLQEKQSTAGAESPKEQKPAVSIDPPKPLEDQGLPSGAASGSRQPEAPIRGANPANIAEGSFRRITPPSETISIPPPPPPTPQQPQWESVPDPRQPARSVPPAVPGSVRMPKLDTPAPSCILLGNRLDNFALRDLDGKVWEYKRRRGRVVLLDFWYTGCSYCLQEIYQLAELQRDYGKHGLEVVSIACERGGTIEEQRQNVRRIRLRKGINYVTLLSGGESCPVMSQFQVEFYPLLVLIDSDGTIIWRSTRDGMDLNAHYSLRKLINDRLVARQPQP